MVEGCKTMLNKLLNKFIFYINLKHILYYWILFYKAFIILIDKDTKPLK